jgi:YbbR domain-containing protein
MNRINKLWAFLTKPEVYWRFFSLALAIIFWLLATGDGTLGETERTITLGVRVQNIPSDLVLLDPPESVRVSIRGLAPLVNRGETAISASINLTGAVEGTETYSVEVEAPLGVSVVNVNPAWVSVYTEDVGEASFPVTLVFLGIDRTRVMMSMRPSPEVITVRGARSILEEVDHVVAYLGIDPQLNLSGSFPVQALDARGHNLSGLAMDPAAIQIVEVDDNGEE